MLYRRRRAGSERQERDNGDQNIKKVILIIEKWKYIVLSCIIVWVPFTLDMLETIKIITIQTLQREKNYDDFITHVLVGN